MTSQVNFGDGGLMVPTYPDTTALKTYAHTLNYAMHTVIHLTTEMDLQYVLQFPNH